MRDTTSRNLLHIENRDAGVFGDQCSRGRALKGNLITPCTTFAAVHANTDARGARLWQRMSLFVSLPQKVRGFSISSML